MRVYLMGASLALLTTTGAFAQADMMAPIYGNTVIVVDKGGMESHTMYNADHTFAGTVPSMSYDYKGTWAADDKSQLCRTFDPPVPGRTNPDCEPWATHAVGDKWTTADGSAETLAAGAATAAAPATPAAPAAPVTPATPSKP